MLTPDEPTSTVMHMPSRRCTLLALLLAAACATGIDEESPAERSAPTPEPASADSAAPALQPWRPSGGSARASLHEEPTVVRLTEGVYWIAPSVLMEVAAELAAGKVTLARSGSNLRVEHASTDTVAASLGLLPGDLVSELAGVAPTDPDAVRMVNASVREGRRLDLRVERAGKELWLRYHVERFGPAGSPGETVRAQLVAVAAAGIVGLGNTRRVIDRELLRKLVEPPLRSTVVFPDVLRQLDLPTDSTILEVGSHAIVDGADLPAMLATQAEASAFTVRFESAGKTAALEIEVVDGLLALDDLTAAIERVEALDGLAVARTPPDPTRAADVMARASAAIDCPARERCTVERAFLEDLFAEPSILARQARLMPSLENGTPDGFKIYGIRKNSLFDLFGFVNGDTLLAVDGKSLESPERALEAYGAVRKASSFELKIRRKLETFTKTIEVR